MNRRAGEPSFEHGMRRAADLYAADPAAEPFDVPAVSPPAYSHRRGH